MGDQMDFFLELSQRRIQKIPNRQTSRGFTLLELMVVMACVAILSAAAVPAIREYFLTVSLKKAVHQLSGDLYRIKSQAIRSNANCTINFNVGPSFYTLSDPVRTVNLSDFDGNVVFTGNPSALPEVFSPVITFNTRGLLVPAVQTQVYVTNQQNRIFRVQVSAAGAISIRAWNAASNTWMR